MKNICLFGLAISLFIACSGSEKKQEAATSETPTDSVATPAPKNCQTVIEADKLGKVNTYQESAKPLTVAITLEQDTSATETGKGCFFNNAVTILAQKKSGDRIFKRTLTKDDLLYYVKTDDVVGRSVLQNTTYKPSFNAQRYVTITMQLLDPSNQKTSDYVVFMNYFGEIVKVK